MHELEIVNGQASFVALRKPGWHKLGTVLDKEVSVYEMMEIGNLAGWEVEKSPLINVNGFEHPDLFEVTRIHPETGERSPFPNVVVGNRYATIQNEQAFTFADALLDFEAIPETVGSIRDGRIVFACFRIPKEIKIGGVDTLHSYLTLGTSHDGTMSLTAFTTCMRAVCSNTFHFSLGSTKNKYVVRHTPSHETKVEDAKRALGIADRWLAEFEKIAESLVQVKMTTGQFREMATAVYPQPKEDSEKRAQTRWTNRLDTLEKIFGGEGEYGDTTGEVGQTAWAGYNALTEAMDWYRTNEDGVVRPSRLAQSAGLIGTLGDQKGNVLAQVREFVNEEMKEVAKV